MQKDTSGQWCAQIYSHKVPLFSSEHLLPKTSVPAPASGNHVNMIKA